MKSQYLLFFLTFIFSSVFSQEYKPIDTADFQQRKTFLTEYKIINEAYVKTLKSHNPGATGRELAKTYSAFQEKFQKEIKNRDYVFNSEFSSRLEAYFGKLKNEQNSGEEIIKILVARDNTPNAFCIQDGVFIVNMGLFNWIDNEEQLISILAHEWGHKILNHSEKRYKKLIEDELQTKSAVTEIALAKVNKTDKAFDLFKDQIYESNAYRRKNESQADSIGYVIYEKTGLKKGEYINALRNLQKFDTISPLTVKIETYRKIFNLPAQSFKEKWLKKEDFSAYNYDNFKDKLDKDSLSTHPEVEKRIQYLKTIFKELATEKAPEESTAKDFLALKKIARLEMLPNYYHSEDYGAGIYLALQFLQEEENESYYRNWLGKNFQKIYDARRKYNLNRYLDRLDPKNQDESYQQFLNFMWNLSLEDIKNIAEFYAPKAT